LSRLDRRTPVYAFAIGDEVKMLPPINRDAPWLDPPVAADAVHSPIAQQVRQALQQLDRTNVQAVLLFTDGRDTSPRPAGDAVPGPAPVFPVFMAGGQVKDLAVVGVDMPPAVFAGEALVARLNMRGAGYDFRRLQGEATMSVDGSPASTAPLRLRDRRLEAEFSRVLESPGVHRVTLTAPAQEGEISTANNQIERWIKVLPQKVNITALAGSPGWDFRIVCGMLARTPWCSCARRC